MNDPTRPAAETPQTPAEDTGGNTISPLPGEPGIPQVTAQQPLSWSKKGMLSLALLAISLLLVLVLSIQRLTTSGPAQEEASALVRDRPSAASAGTRQLDMAVPPPPRIPALLPAADTAVEPIGVRRTGQDAPPATGSKGLLPEDAPVLVVTSRPGALSTHSATDEPPPPEDPLANTSRNLQDYQRQLQGLLDSLTQSTALATEQRSSASPPGGLLAGPLGGPPGAGAPAAAPGLFGGQLQGSATPRVAARHLGDRNLTLPKGTAFTCVLKTEVISATSGLVGCQVQRHVFGDNGRVLLIERGSHLDGEYRIASVRPGSVRIPVLWTRIRTPLGVTVDIDSPGTGQLGASGIDGHVDNRWGERIGAAMLLSLIDDSVKLVIQNQAQDQQADTIVLPATTANSSKLAEKVLDSTINIPPLLVQNQGGIVGIYVARDVDFSSVYELQPGAR
jgi:type IV secretion system protein VirB10